MNSAPEIRSSHKVIGKVHGQIVFKRRIAVLAKKLAAMVPPHSSILDIGCGDGSISRLISDSVPGVEIAGAEFARRHDCAIPCTEFDGKNLPFPDKSFDGCMFVDVLHHTLDPLALVKDAVRVSQKFVLIKDHLQENVLDRWTLRFMDWVGNRPHGVVLPYAYLSKKQWQTLFCGAGLTESKCERTIPLYPFPFSLVFGRNLHFICLLSIHSTSCN